MVNKLTILNVTKGGIMEKLNLSMHARQRMAQRNLAKDDITFVLQFGRLEYRTGAEFYFLAKKDVPSNLLKKYQRLIGTTLLFTNGQLVTVYRNINAHSSIRRKLKQSSFNSKQIHLSLAA